MNIVDKIRDLITKDKTEQALKELKTVLEGKDEDLLTQIDLHMANYARGKKKHNIGALDDEDWSKIVVKVNYAILELLRELPEDLTSNTPSNNTSNETEKKTSGKKNVFISYNHSNSDVAEKLRQRLTDADINVIIDKEKMLAGEDIKQFIENCVRESDITLSLISKRSLMSAWVAMESVNTFYHEKTSNKRFIACYIEDSFFARSFTDEVLDHIDKEIDDIQNTITKRMERNRGIADLQNELKRFRDLQNNIDEIIRRLRESLCIDISGDKLDANLPKILESINA